MKKLMVVMTVLALALMYGRSGPVTAAQSAASGAAATLRLVHVAHFQLAVTGQRWGRSSQVTVTLHAGAVARHTLLTTTAKGSFIVGINGLDRCSAVSLTARDRTGRHRKLNARKPRQSQCSGSPLAPVLRVLKGQVVSPPLALTASPTASSTASPTASPTAAPTVVVSGVTGNWTVYTSAQGAFTVEYPSSWAATEYAGSNGELVAAFAGSDGNFSVTVASGVPADLGDKRIGNVYCHPITVAGLPAQQCLDTIAFMTYATLTSHNKTYTIAARVKGGDAKVYEHALETFRLTQ